MNAPPRSFNPQVVHSCLRNRNWQLVDSADLAAWESFLDAVADLLRVGDLSPLPAAKRLENAVTGAYCTVLYVACTADGTRRQHRAYSEVWNWVYRFVAYRVNDPYDREDITQEVLEFVFQNLRQVDRTAGFLAWVGYVAHNRIRRHYAKIGAERRRFVDDFPDEDTDEPNPIVPTTDANLISLQLEETSSHAHILKLIDECMPRKAYLQKIVFIERGLQQRTVSEIAQMLDRTASDVYTSWFNALRTIKKHCPKLIAYIIVYLSPSQRVQHIGDAS